MDECSDVCEGCGEELWLCCHEMLHDRIVQFEADKEEMLDGMERMDAQIAKLKEENALYHYALKTLVKNRDVVGDTAANIAETVLEDK